MDALTSLLLNDFVFEKRDWHAALEDIAHVVLEHTWKTRQRVYSISESAVEYPEVDLPDGRAFAYQHDTANLLSDVGATAGGLIRLLSKAKSIY